MGIFRAGTGTNQWISTEIEYVFYLKLSVIRTTSPLKNTFEQKCAG